jgi:hypothetical protein
MISVYAKLNAVLSIVMSVYVMGIGIMVEVIVANHLDGGFKIDPRNISVESGEGSP